MHIIFSSFNKENARYIYSFNNPNQLAKYILPLPAFSVKSVLKILLFLGAITWHSVVIQFWFQVLSITDTRTAWHINPRSGYHLPRIANWQISKIYSHHLWRLFLVPQNLLYHVVSSKKNTSLKSELSFTFTEQLLVTKFLTILWSL